MAIVEVSFARDGPLAQEAVVRNNVLLCESLHTTTDASQVFSRHSFPQKMLKAKAPSRFHERTNVLASCCPVAQIAPPLFKEGSCDHHLLTMASIDHTSGPSSNIHMRSYARALDCRSSTTPSQRDSLMRIVRCNPQKQTKVQANERHYLLLLLALCPAHCGTCFDTLLAPEDLTTIKPIISATVSNDAVSSFRVNTCALWRVAALAKLVDVVLSN